ncbi:MAG: nitrilase-related carbon-nitrogen hydrolase [Bacillota bacterium]|nr:nitrilase-related carbon-nitrogen hydrolase [Bacillota bacterium]
MKAIKVASIQYEPIKKQVDKNLKNITDLIIEASENGAELIVLPEMCTTGYIWQDRQEIKPFVETIPGKTTDLISNLTRKYNNYVVIGMGEKNDKDIYYNSAALVGPEGYIGRYRKVHSFIADPMWAKDGDEGIKVFKTKIGNIGICICMDLNIPETTKIMYRKGCDVICAPCNWTGEKVPSTFWHQRALETDTPIIISNRWGEEKGVVFTGGSCIIDQKGDLVNYKEKDNVCVYADLQIEEEKLEMPKYSFYKELIRNPYTWNPVWFYKQYDNKLPKGKKFKISTLQIKRRRLSSREEISKILIDSIKKEQSKNSKLILFPKNILNPYINGKIEILEKEILETMIGEIIKNIAEDTYVVVSYLNKQKKSTALILKGEGIVYEYEQIFSKETKNSYEEGDLNYFDTEYGRFGILFGEELINFEFARILTLKGIDLLLIPDESGKEYNKLNSEKNILWTMAKSRSRENNIYTVYSNYSNENENIGYSGIFGPNSFFKENDYIYSKFSEGMLSMEVNTEEKSKKFPQNTIKYKPFMHSRKIDFYEDLI